jgi:hypothetical protein
MPPDDPNISRKLNWEKLYLNFEKSKQIKDSSDNLYLMCNK